MNLMHDETSILPWHDLPQARLRTLKRHLLAEISRADTTAPKPRLNIASAPRRQAVVASCGVIAAAGVAALVVMTQAGAPRVNPSASHDHWSQMPLIEPMALDFTMGSQGVTAINVTVNTALSDASLQIQVLRSNATQPLQALQQAPEDQQVVYSEQVSMSNVAPPASNVPGATTFSTWSGMLSPSDWTGGCQNSLYTVEASITTADGSPAGSTEARWFNCSSG